MPPETSQTSNEESHRDLGKANGGNVEELACIERLNKESIGDAQSINRTVELHLFYFALVRLGNAGQWKTVAIMYCPEGGSYVD